MLNPEPRDELRRLVQEYGRDLSTQSGRVGGLLRDTVGQFRLEISLILAAVDEGVAAELSREVPGTVVPGRAAQLARRLESGRGLSAENAQWAVDAWAYALAAGEREEAAPAPPRDPTPPTTLVPDQVAEQAPPPPPPPPLSPTPAPTPTPAPAAGAGRPNRRPAIIAAVIVAVLVVAAVSIKLASGGGNDAGPVVTSTPPPIPQTTFPTTPPPTTPPLADARIDGTWVGTMKLSKSRNFTGASKFTHRAEFKLTAHCAGTACSSVSWTATHHLRYGTVHTKGTMRSSNDGFFTGSDRHVYFDTICTADSKKTYSDVYLTVSATHQVFVGDVWRATSLQGALSVFIPKTKSCGASRLVFFFKGPLS